MDPRYNPPPHAYPNGQYVPFTPQPPPNGYQQYGQPPQYPHMPMQMQPQMQPQMHQGYPPVQSSQGHPQVVIPRPQPQPHQYAPMHQQMYPQQPHMQPQPQQQQRTHPQVMIPQRTPSSAMPMQMGQPRIRHVQVPVQRASTGGVAQMDGPQDQYRRHSAQQAPMPPISKPQQQTSPYQENAQRPQQSIPNTPNQNQNQHRVPLQPHATPQQRPQPQPQQQPQSQPQSQLHTPSTQYKSPSVQQTPSQSRPHPKVVVQRTPSHQLTTPTKQPHAAPKALPVDLYVMLLSAADEYIAAARSLGSTIARSRRDADLQQYYKLMSTAMGCMDAVLKKFNMLPRDEAKLRLRYASLLVEETDNTTEIDEVLSKGISLCGRCRLQDLKYAMLHLQARYQFKTNHRAALKSLDKPINEAETFQHVAWVYAFRFLKVSLTLQIPGRIEAVPALQQLHAISAHAERHGDRAIYVACSALNAMIHLRSGAQDRIVEAQRAIATARSLQLQESAKQLGSFGSLLDVIDLACGIQQGSPDNQKSTALIEAMMGENTSSSHSESGVFGVLLERSSAGNMTFDTGGIFKKSADGRDELVFAWLPREDLKTLCFHISALDQNVHERGFRYIREAHHRSKGALARQSTHSIPISIAFAQADWGRVLDWHTIFTLGLIACFQEDGATAKDALSILKKRIAKPPFDNQETYLHTLSYLGAILDQTGGLLNSALTTYSSDLFALPEKISHATFKTDMAILAGLNRVLIVRNPAHPEYDTTGALLTQLQLFCENHPNQYMKMAFRVVYAMSSPNSSINRQKTLTNNATSKSHELFKRTQNREFVIMALCYFTSRFFVEQVTDKSMPAVQAVRQHAKSSNKPLWLAVACGLVITVFRHNNMVAEADKYQEVFDRVRERLPPALRGDEDVDAEGEDDEEA